MKQNHCFNSIYQAIIFQCVISTYLLLKYSPLNAAETLAMTSVWSEMSRRILTFSNYQSVFAGYTVWTHTLCIMCLPVSHLLCPAIFLCQLVLWSLCETKCFVYLSWHICNLTNEYTAAWVIAIEAFVSRLRTEYISLLL